MTFGGQAATGLQIELPTMHRTGQHSLLNFAKTRQIGLEVGTTALDAIPVTFPELLIRRLLSIVALGVLQAFRRETLEEVVNILVIRSFALGLKATGEKDLVDPVLFVVNNAGFEEGTINVEAVV